MSESDTLGDANRRNFLIKVTSVVGGAGVVAAAVPFVASMNPSSDVLAKATTEVDLSGIPEGGVHTVAWQGKPVFIFHRTPEEIKAMEASDGGFDPEPDAKARHKTGMAGRGRDLHASGLRAEQGRVRAGPAIAMAASMTTAAGSCAAPHRIIWPCRPTISLRQTRSSSAKHRRRPCQTESSNG